MQLLPTEGNSCKYLVGTECVRRMGSERNLVTQQLPGSRVDYAKQGMLMSVLFKDESDDHTTNEFKRNLILSMSVAGSPVAEY